VRMSNDNATSENISFNVENHGVTSVGMFVSGCQRTPSGSALLNMGSWKAKYDVRREFGVENATSRLKLY
jgi:hypothetical protein